LPQRIGGQARQTAVPASGQPPFVTTNVIIKL
jgi:hypothetical protein